MKRDLDLCRHILLVVESSPANTWVQRSSFASEIDPAILGEHVALIDQRGLIDANITRFYGPAPAHFVIKNLTWEGHEFLDAARNESVWTKLKERLKRMGVDSADFPLILNLLRETAQGGGG